MINERLRLQLQDGLQQYPFVVQPSQQQQLLEFLNILTKWNKVHNLTAITQLDSMLSKHLFDSLSVVPFLPATANVLDVGTGAGFPGLPLAIVKPELSFVLLDCVQKKTAFLQHVVATLALANVAVVHTRVEKYHPKAMFDVIISRAFADLGVFVSSGAHLCHKDGFFLAMKGKQSVAAAEVLPDGYQITKSVAVVVPGEIGERCLMFVNRAQK